MQTLITYSIVAVALGYAAWLFTPQVARRWLISGLIVVAPHSLHARLARMRSNTESAGCSTCKGCATDAAETPSIKTIQLHRR